MSKGAWVPKEILKSQFPWGTCFHCHQRYFEGAHIIVVKKGECYHFDCFEGGYRKAGEYTTSYKTRGKDESPMETVESLAAQVVNNPVPVPETIIEPEWVEAMETTLGEPEPVATVPTVPGDAASNVIGGLISLMAGPFDARLSKLEVDTRQALTKALKAIQDTAGKLDESRVLELIAINAVQRVEIKRQDETEYKDLGLQHELFAELLMLCDSRMPNGNRVNVWITGPAGSGKTQAAENVANALGLKFYFTGAVSEPFSLLGFRDASGTYQRTPFRDAYEYGGEFLFDEVDSSEPVAIMPFNAALANGHCAFPDGVIKRHPDCLILASANTWGHGAKDSYVGRNKLDGAFLDRFIVKIPWHVDEKLELAIAGNIAWVKRVQEIRRKVAEKGLKVLVTPRASIAGSILLAKGMNQERVEELVLRSGMTAEQWEGVR